MLRQKIVDLVFHPAYACCGDISASRSRVSDVNRAAKLPVVYCVDCADYEQKALRAARLCCCTVEAVVLSPALLIRCLFLLPATPAVIVLELHRYSSQEALLCRQQRVHGHGQEGDGEEVAGTLRHDESKSSHSALLAR